MKRPDRRRSPLHLLALLALVCSLVLAALPQTAPVAARQPATPATPRALAAEPTSVTIAGSLQSELGCSGDWQPSCATTHLVFDAGDAVWQNTFAVPAGSYDYKAALNDNWDESYGQNGGSGNIPLTLAADTSVKFYYSNATKWVTSNQNSVIATVPGSFQSELGCSGDWQPDCLRSWLQDVDGDGTYSFVTTALPAGTYDGKVAINESWNENYGVGGTRDGANYSFRVATDNAEVTFKYNPTSHVLTIQTGAAQDNEVQWSSLSHDSRDAAFRSPGGAVTTGTPVTVRLRAASNDLTAVRLRVWNDRLDVQSIIDAQAVLNDGRLTWWEATIPASAIPTIYYYRWIVIDGSDTDFYEDDAARTGGLGQPLDESADRGWQISVYDPAFTTPDWVKNGVMYQIFVDRFRDGDPTNNTPAGRFFYDEPGGTIVRSNASDWNQVVCDPRVQTGFQPCFGKYSQNFYGGDLQGVLDQLDYLADLGVTVLYLNPIFESPSNHKYDTTDYTQVDDNFGTNALFANLAAQAEARGMKIVLDGVFNHVSSDSEYMDRYGRFTAVGACESLTSPFRDWFYFRDVTPGQGHCVDSQGRADSAEYESWFGYDSLPKLRADNPAVRDLIWSGPSNVAQQWLNAGGDGWRLDVGGDVDSGWTNAPTNDFWEGFRAAVRAANPQGYIVGEEWGNATPWTLGPEWDATMQYPLGSAIMSYWHPNRFEDNDHNTGSSAGVLEKISPSVLDERLRYLEERYPPQAFQAMMNLLGSHDTARALFMLDPNTGQNNSALYQDPSYSWDAAIANLRGVAMLQLTLPGAPTIYYGDEVGLVGPHSFAGSKWEDDPYNRQPFPWLDQSGTPFYQHLQSQANQNALRDYYKTLIAARNAHPALRTGSFDTLLTDDGKSVYAYGRRMADLSDAAVVVANSSAQTQTVELDVAGYLPIGAVLDDIRLPLTATVSATGRFTVAVPPRDGLVLIMRAPGAAPASPVANLQATAGSTSVSLDWSAANNATRYNVYRSLLSGGGYQLIGTTSTLSYTDSPVASGTRYFYVVKAVNSQGVEAEASAEVAALPFLPIGYAVLQFPTSLNHTLGVTRTQSIYGQIYVAGLTDSPNGDPASILAEVGYGPTGSDPVAGTDWTWETATFNTKNGNNYEYQATLRPTAVGTFDLLYRFSTSLGEQWTYGDADGFFPGEPGTDQPGTLTVTANADTEPTAAPTNLAVDTYSASSISLSWAAVQGAVEYWVMRVASDTPGNQIQVGTVLSPTTTFVDDSVTNGITYTYTVVAVDHALNRSAPSNSVTEQARVKMVPTTFRVRVPDETPADETIYLTGNQSIFGPWDAGRHPMTRDLTDPLLWTTTVSLPDGTALEYKYTRGTFDKVENWGALAGFTNRSIVINSGVASAVTIDNTIDAGSDSDFSQAVRFWRDALVESVDVVSATGVVTVTWATPVEPTIPLTRVVQVLSNGVPVSGTVSRVNPSTFVFHPANALVLDVYDIRAFGVRRSNVNDGQVQQRPYLLTAVRLGTIHWVIAPLVTHP